MSSLGEVATSDDASSDAVRFVAAGHVPPPLMPVDRADVYRTLRLMAFVAMLLAASVIADQIDAPQAMLTITLVTTASLIFVVGPGLVARVGERVAKTDGRDADEGVLKASRLAISRERLQMARIAVAPSDLTWRVVPRLRSDLATVLRVRHGLDLDNPRHRPAIEDIIGPDGVLLLEGAPAIESWHQDRVSKAIHGCLASVARNRQGDNA
ncbi:MAG: hypothetical protein R2770_06010 [Acidimicrobiales bacterium]|nr:hypothetical protein [Acidimicrobiales bacterium]